MTHEQAIKDRKALRDGIADWLRLVRTVREFTVNSSPEAQHWLKESARTLRCRLHPPGTRLAGMGASA